MKILVVGNGGREHTIIWKIKQNKNVKKIYCAAGNGGISRDCETIDINPMEIDKLVDFATKEQIDFTIVGMDDPLVAGIVDAFEAANLKVFGPRKNAAQIEGSKSFSKKLMEKYNIPTAKYEAFDDYKKACDYVSNHSLPLVIKADGLALGKGVVICENKEDALKELDEIMNSKKFGEAGKTVVIEEFLTGPEVSVLAFCDGETVVPMVSAQDHKRALDNDLGLNTGGMGTFSPSRVYNDDLAKTCMETIFKPTVVAMQKEGCPFVGILYFGLMLTADGMKVIEYNCRFGDPETQVVLPRLETDLLDIMIACTEKRLDKINVTWLDNACVCVVLASGGYPLDYKKGYPVTGLLDIAKRDDILVFHAGTAIKDDEIVTNGGRVLGITGIGKDLDDAIKIAYDGVTYVDFKDKHFRKDIGKPRTI